MRARAGRTRGQVAVAGTTGIGHCRQAENFLERKIFVHPASVSASPYLLQAAIDQA
jgi:hypothetical protein